jgi:aspartate racemase
LKEKSSVKTIGLLGGMTYLSSVVYYQIINKTVSEKLGRFHSAKCILYSSDFEEIEKLQEQGEWEELGRILTASAQILERAGVDLIVICANTMHKVAEVVEENVRVPLLHIADATAERIVARGLRTVGLIGTDFTMKEDFYKKRLKQKYGIDAIIPPEGDRRVICDVIYNELTFGIVKPSSRQKYKTIIEGLVLNGAEGVILGCTEIPFLINQNDIETPLFDTTAIHSMAAAEFALR